MKCMIVFSALVALSAAGLAPITYSGLPLAYASPYGLGLHSYGVSPYLSSVVASPALTHYAAPAVTAYSAPAVVAAPSVLAAQTVVAAPTVVAAGAVKTQYHAQDELGQASYGHSEPLQAHNAVQDAAGNKVGSFSYVAPDGRVLRTDYVADALGYRVNSNALPVGPGAGPLPVADTPEVVAARIAHLAAHGRAKRDLVALGHTPAATAPLAAPLAYSAISPFAYSGIPAPLAYSGIPAPLAYSASPLAYSASPLAYSAAIPSAVHRAATLTTVVNNPGHAVSYRVD